MNSSLVCHGVTSYCDQIVPGANVNLGVYKTPYCTKTTALTLLAKSTPVQTLGEGIF